MLADAAKSYSETFIVWNDDINFVGAVVPFNTGKAAVCGTVNFKNGEKLSFSSQPDDCEKLLEQLMSLCLSIATIYGTNVIRRKYPMMDSVNETSVLIKAEHHLLKVRISKN